VVQVPGQPDEAVADQRNADEADQEDKGDRLSDGPDQALAVSDIARVGPTRATDSASATQNGSRRRGIWSTSFDGPAGVSVVIDVSFF
jgi:hypothetical protein